MRDIKFRAWANYGEMLANVQNHIGNDSWAFGNMIKSDDFEIMVYEGDIIALENTKERFSYNIYVVLYCVKSGAFVCTCDDDVDNLPSVLGYSGADGEYMVIGNIYENPELLKSRN